VLWRRADFPTPFGPAINTVDPVSSKSRVFSPLINGIKMVFVVFMGALVAAIRRELWAIASNWQRGAPAAPQFGRLCCGFPLGVGGRSLRGLDGKPLSRPCRPGGSDRPIAASAAVTRWRLSFTALSGRPTTWKRGRPGAIWHCTSTVRASRPRYATVETSATKAIPPKPTVPPVRAVMTERRRAVEGMAPIPTRINPVLALGVSETVNGAAPPNGHVEPPCPYARARRALGLSCVGSPRLR
jgi:hypothetical protein